MNDFQVFTVFVLMAANYTGNDIIFLGFGFIKSISIR